MITPERSWWLSGLLLGLLMTGLALISPHFATGLPYEQMPFLVLVIILMVAAGVLILQTSVIRRVPTTRSTLFWLLAVGLFLRLVMLPSTVIREDDFHRYLLDGAMTAHGLNPYAHSPATVIAAPDGPLAMIADAGHEHLPHVNHPRLRTIYPPLTQVAFAVAHWLTPWQVLGLRLLWLGCDLISLTLGWQLLRRLDRSPLWLTLFWWNPLYIKEMSNSVHMEALLLPWLLGALLTYRRPLLASSLLAAATAVKVWPLLLLPTILRATAWRQALMAAGWFTGLVALAYLPVLSAGLGADSGFVAYSDRWQNSAPLYRLTLETVQATLGHWLDPETLQRGIRLLLAASAGLVALIINGRAPGNLDEVVGRFTVVCAAVFLLSPARFPWYSGWFIALLPLRPWPFLLALIALLPLYYLRYYLEVRDGFGYYRDGIVVMMFLPVWSLLLYQGWQCYSRDP